MRARALVHLATLNLRSDRRGALVNAGAACLGAAALVFFVALGIGVGQAARRMFAGDARLVEVVPAAVSLGGALGGGQLDDAAVERLKGVPGVLGAYRRLSLRVPVAASRAPEGVKVNWPPGFTVQVPVVGVDPELLAGDVARGMRFEDPPPGGAVPVLASRRLLEVYNKTIAPAWNLRRLPPGLDLVGLEFPVRVGFSIIPLKTEDRVYDARLLLVGLSERVPLYSIAVPLATVRRLHAEYGKVDPGYTAVTLEVRRPDDVPKVVSAVRSMGFGVDEGERAIAERVGLAIAITAGALSLLALLMTALAALAIAQSLSASVRARTRDIAILEALGATAGDVRSLVLAEAGLLGLSGGVVGVALARLAALAADRAALRFLPDFPFRPETFFSFPAWLYLLGVAISVGAALVGALAPAAAAARVDPARAVS
ncbi:MAG TPA: ABC transporter permease [Anaeromyxobacteraceae bacterium]|nr:ABC transporter permease [Anaeromyxobacteraceae bacterium]